MIKENMTIKEYLSQAHYIDQRINSKIEQVASLRNLTTKATATLTDMPGSASRSSHPMEDIIVKMIDFENEINADIDCLVDLNVEITSLIKRVENPEHRALLELRYLCFKTWVQIAVEMEYDLRWIYRMHKKALTDAKTVMIKTRHEKTL
ncbi:DUF1492 domain-containing protein [Anaerotignum sp.]|uniref:DUF1492 domain-containing protein n=1 Tax=Anaerotignum sp. TaxID=2039241 RepID=UPI00289CDDFC|nr:DUF1492 domain-containing protein [Anaerotignum sp.]